jgi:hypothetical protein
LCAGYASLANATAPRPRNRRNLPKTKTCPGTPFVPPLFSFCSRSVPDRPTRTGLDGPRPQRIAACPQPKPYSPTPEPSKQRAQRPVSRSCAQPPPHDLAWPGAWVRNWNRSRYVLALFSICSLFGGGRPSPPPVQRHNPTPLNWVTLKISKGYRPTS